NENIETLLDFVQDIDISEQSVEKEKPIIASEIKMYQDNADWQALYLTLNSLYHHHPIKLDIAGSIKSIYEINRDNLYQYYQTFYHPSNMILFICGNVKVEEVSELIINNQNKKTFSDITKKLVKVNEPTSIVSSELIKKMSINNNKISLNFKVNEFIMDAFKQDICMDLLMNMLFSEKNDFYLDLLNNEKITAEYYYSYQQDQVLNYAFISFEFVSDDIDYLKHYLINFFKQDIATLINKKQFEIAKAKYIGRFIKLFNNPEAIANTFISYYFLDYDLFNSLELIKTISFNDIKQVSSLFNLDNHSFTIIKPLE
ncbi:MAG: insulinase family protein, partial [Bacilli bacterium]|nr:insulinase family protein [Bacilli bacterium]